MALTEEQRQTLIDQVRSQQDQQIFDTDRSAFEQSILSAAEPSGVGRSIAERIRGFLGGAEEAVLGAGAAGFGALAGLGTLAQRGGEQLLRTGGLPLPGGIPSPPLTREFQERLGITREQAAARPSLAERAIPEGLRQPPETGPGRAGFIGGEIAQFLIPGAAPARAGRAAAGLRGLSQLPARFKKLVEPLAKAGAEGLSALGITAIQEGEVGREAAQVGGVAAALPLALRGGAAAARVVGRPIARGVAEVGSQLLGKTTGAGESAIKELFRNPNVIKFAREAGVDADTFQDDLLSSATQGLKNIRIQRGADYQTALRGIEQDTTKLTGVLQKTQTSARKLLGNRSIGVDANNKLNFSKSTITGDSDIKNIGRAFEDTLNWEDTTPLGLDRLKRRLSDFEDQATSNTAKSIIKNLRKDVTDGLNKNVEGYKAMTQQYAQASTLIDEIQAGLGVDKARTRQQAINKLLSTLRPGREQNFELARELQKATGDDIVARIAGGAFQDVIPRSLAGTFITTGGILGLIINPSAWPALSLYFASGSPRLVGEFVNVLGEASRQLAKTGEVDDNVIRIFRQLILQAEEDRQGGGERGELPEDIFGAPLPPAEIPGGPIFPGGAQAPGAAQLPGTPGLPGGAQGLPAFPQAPLQ